ncbi:hypothetical protein Smp_000410 [Schistosoma mansoni]|uniref:hypothetical protein n=1 Tax=Schistosoma mansoni TaxID=6183 RepID=UPI00022C81AD|nr:hypothetical protein Smp_000410 [Schistosoma mansoni]|eukprot:XP_018646331.1 hypothetical protein Smp_000410 [Schistosoma mansoni]
MYPNKKPNKIPLTRKYIMEGEAKHIHQKHGEKHIKAVGSDYELTTTFHKGSISTKSGKPKYFSTYDTEGLMKHYQNTHGRAKFNLNAKSHGHEKYKDQKEMKATVTFENNDNTIDDESNYSPTTEQSMRKLKELKHRKYNEYYKDNEEEEEGGEYNDRYYRPRDEPDIESTEETTEGPRRTTTTPIFMGE